MHGTFFELSRSARLKPTVGVDRLVDSCCGPTARAVAYCRHTFVSICRQPRHICKRSLIESGLPRLCSQQALGAAHDGACCTSVCIDIEHRAWGSWFHHLARPRHGGGVARGGGLEAALRAHAPLRQRLALAQLLAPQAARHHVRARP